MADTPSGSEQQAIQSPPALLVRLAAMVELLAELADASRQLFMAFEAELAPQSSDETREIAHPPPPRRDCAVEE